MTLPAGWNRRLFARGQFNCGRPVAQDWLRRCRSKHSLTGPPPFQVTRADSLSIDGPTAPVRMLLTSGLLLCKL